MALVLLMGSLVGIVASATAAAALSAGDVAIIGVRADDIDGTAGNGNEDAFAWVPLVDLPAGAEIFFTDAGWTAGGAFRPMEGAIKYTAPAGGIPAGTVMLLEFKPKQVTPSGSYVFTPSGGGGTYSDADDANVGTTGMQPATPGDQVLVFEGSTASPTFLWGWKNEGPWDADATSNDTSALPAGLTDGVNAMTVDTDENSWDDSRYVGPTSGTPAQLAAAIADRSNWELTDIFPFPSGGNDITNGTLTGGGFTVGTGDTTPPVLSLPADITTGNDAGQCGAIVDFTVTATDDSGTATVSTTPLPGSFFDVGTTPVNATATDPSGNTAEGSFNVTVNDTEPPTAVTQDPVVALDANGEFTITFGFIVSTIFVSRADNCATNNTRFNLTGPQTYTCQHLGPNPQTAFSFDQAGNQLATDFVLTITDPLGVCNTAPTITSASSAQVPENQTSAIDVQATDDNDAEGAGLTFTLSGGADQGLFGIDAGTGLVTFNSAPDFDAPGDAGGDNGYDIQVTVTDSGGLTDVQDITITVTNVNEAPVLGAIGDQSVDEGQTSSVVLGATDPDGDGLAFSTSGLPGFCVLTDGGDGTGSLDCSPGFADSGSYVVTVSVTDTGSPVLADSETFTITVGDVNRAPVLGAVGGQSVDEGQVLSVGLTASDPDGDGLVLSASGLPGFCSLVDNGDGTGSVDCVPGFDDAGTYSVTVTVVDDGSPSLSASETFEVVVGDVNRAPVLGAVGGQSVDEGQVLSVGLTASDPDGDGLVLSASGLPGFCSLVDNGDGTGSVDCVPGFDDAGTYSVTVTVVDDGSPSLSASETFEAVVGDVNRAPVLGAVGDQSVDEGQVLSVGLTASDPDGDGLVLSASGLPGFCSLVDNGDGTGSLDCAPGFTDSGSFDVTVTVTDDGSPALDDAETFTIVVNEINDPPVADAGADASVTVPDPVVLAGSASDDGNPDPPGAVTFLWSVVSGPGSVTFGDASSASTTATFGAGGVFTLRLTVSDGQLTATDDVEITVDNPLGCTIIGTNGPDTLVGTSGPDTICGFAGNDDIDGGDGDDTIFAGDDNDKVQGGLGNDIIDGGAGNDRMFGGGGDDDMQASSGVNTFDGQGGDDTIRGGGGTDTIDGSGGADVILGNGGDDTLRGGSGGDTITGGAGDDLLQGGSGNDKLRDAAGDDQLFGQGGNDRLRDLVGNNVLNGGAGNNQCTTAGGTSAC